MDSVKLVWITPNAEQVIGYCARVSNPKNQDNPNVAKLLHYCANHRHWSIFEMASMCVEINTTRAIATQILRHRSFCLGGDVMLYFDGSELGKSFVDKRSIRDVYDLWHNNTAVASRPGSGNIENYSGADNLIPILQNAGDRGGTRSSDTIQKMALRCYDEKSATFSTTAIKNIWQSGVKPLFRVYAANNYYIDCTADHLLLTPRGYRSIKGGLGVTLIDGRVVFNSHQEMFVACNGIASSIKEDTLTVQWAKITRIEYLGEQEVFDLEVENNNHNFVANGIVVHNCFQQFSLRYAEAEELTIPEIRRQDRQNRQSSIDDLDAELKDWWEQEVNQLYDKVETLYKTALDRGVAKECARGILPLSTAARLYASGTIRSWIHYLQVRANPESGTQKEHFDLACQIKAIFREQMPEIYRATLEDLGV